MTLRNKCDNEKNALVEMGVHLTHLQEMKDKLFNENKEFEIKVSEAEIRAKEAELQFERLKLKMITTKGDKDAQLPDCSVCKTVKASVVCTKCCQVVMCVPCHGHAVQFGSKCPLCRDEGTRVSLRGVHPS